MIMPWRLMRSLCEGILHSQLKITTAPTISVAGMGRTKLLPPVRQLLGGIRLIDVLMEERKDLGGQHSCHIVVSALHRVTRQQGSEPSLTLCHTAVESKHACDVPRQAAMRF